MVMAEDLENMEMLPHQFYNFHPGSHVGQGVEAGIQWIVSLLNTTLRPDQTTLFLLETMSGKGSEIGRSFEELKAILDGVHRSEKMGICLIPVTYIPQVTTLSTTWTAYWRNSTGSLAWIV